MPRSMKDPEARLQERNGDAPVGIVRRLTRAREEIAAWRQYDYLIINRDVKEAVDQLATVIQAERWRTSRLTLKFPDVEVPEGWHSPRWSSPSTRCPTAICWWSWRPSARASSTAARWRRSRPSTRNRPARRSKRSPTPRSVIASAKRTQRSSRTAMSVAGKEIILGVSGSIAAYKAVLRLRELTARDAKVAVVMTAGAEHFVGPLTFRTLSGRPVLSNIFDPQSDDAVEHAALAERAHAFVVAPATANVLAKAAHGIADDFLTTLLLAARCPVLIAPAMDRGMWDHAAVAANVATLRERGVTVLEPEAGALASGLSGRGRLPEVDTIVEALERLLAPRRDLAGARLLVTSGATRQPTLPVRRISNLL